MLASDCSMREYGAGGGGRGARIALHGEPPTTFVGAAGDEDGRGHDPAAGTAHPRRTRATPARQSDDEAEVSCWRTTARPRFRWENPKTKGVRRTALFLGQSWSFSRHKSERQEWRNSSVRRAEQPERRQFGENSSSIPLTRRCALHVRTKALCGSGKGQPGPSGSEERQCARTARPLFTLVLARTVRQMLWGQCRSEIEGGPGVRLFAYRGVAERAVLE